MRCCEYGTSFRPSPTKTPRFTASSCWLNRSNSALAIVPSCAVMEAARACSTAASATIPVVPSRCFLVRFASAACCCAAAKSMRWRRIAISWVRFRTLAS